MRDPLLPLVYQTDKRCVYVHRFLGHWRANTVRAGAWDGVSVQWHQESLVQQLKKLSYTHTRATFIFDDQLAIDKFLSDEAVAFKHMRAHFAIARTFERQALVLTADELLDQVRLLDPNIDPAPGENPASWSFNVLSAMFNPGPIEVLNPAAFSTSRALVWQLCTHQLDTDNDAFAHIKALTAVKAMFQAASNPAAAIDDVEPVNTAKFSENVVFAKGEGLSEDDESGLLIIPQGSGFKICADSLSSDGTRFFTTNDDSIGKLAGGTDAIEVGFIVRFDSGGGYRECSGQLQVWNPLSRVLPFDIASSVFA